MSRKNKNRNRASQTETVASAEEQTPVETAAETGVVEQGEEAVVVDETEVSAEEQTNNEIGPEITEESAPVESAPVAPTPAAPTVTVVPPPDETTAPATKKVVMAEELYSSLSALQQRRKVLPTHTARGERLIRMIEEYVTRMAVKTNDVRELKDRIGMLHRIVSVACPLQESDIDATSAADLVRIMFDAISANRNGAFAENMVFKLDYKLPAGPKAIDRLNGFVTAMTQMVDAVKNGTRIHFDERALALVIANKRVMTAISGLKRGIEAKQESERDRL